MGGNARTVYRGLYLALADIACCGSGDYWGLGPIEWLLQWDRLWLTGAKVALSVPGS